MNNNNKPATKNSNPDLDPFIRISIFTILIAILFIIIQGKTTCSPIPCGARSIEHTIAEACSWAIPTLILTWLIFAVNKIIKNNKNISTKIPVRASLFTILLLAIVTLGNGASWYKQTPIGPRGTKSMLFTVRNHLIWFIPIMFLIWLIFSIHSKSISKKTAPLWIVAAILVPILMVLIFINSII